MALFRIPDIRLFWSNDERSLNTVPFDDRLISFDDNCHNLFLSLSIYYLSLSLSRRFLRQFAEHATKRDITFVPYSKYPPIWHDVSFWLSESFHVNKFHELVRDLGGDLVEDVRLTDQFTNAKTQRTSNTFRITYRHMDRSLTSGEIDAIQEQVCRLQSVNTTVVCGPNSFDNLDSFKKKKKVRARLHSDLGVELRDKK
jgi:hypothetical protein